MASHDQPRGWAPWVVAAIASALAIAGWTRTPTPIASRPPPQERSLLPSLREDAGAEPLGALARCTCRLRRMREVVHELPSAEHSVTVAWVLEEDAGVSPSALACLRQPEVASRALGEARARQDAARRDERARRLAAVRSGLAQSLGMSEGDIDWMDSYVCSV